MSKYIKIYIVQNLCDKKTLTVICKCKQNMSKYIKKYIVKNVYDKKTLKLFEDADEIFQNMSKYKEIFVTKRHWHYLKNQIIYFKIYQNR